MPPIIRVSFPAKSQPLNDEVELSLQYDAAPVGRNLMVPLLFDRTNSRSQRDRDASSCCVTATTRSRGTLRRPRSEGGFVPTGIRCSGVTSQRTADSAHPGPFLGKGFLFRSLALATFCCW